MRKKKTYGVSSGKTLLFLLAAGMLLTGCGESKAAREARLQGIQELEAGQWEEAIASFETALEHADGIVDEFELDILKYRGEAEYRLGDYEAAAYTYQILAEVDGAKREYAEWQNSARIQQMNQQGTELLKEGKTDEARVIFETGLDTLLKSDSEVEKAEELEAIFVYNIGAAYEHMGEFSKALEQFQQYGSRYGLTPELEKEIAFLEYCQDGGEEWPN